MCIYIYIVRVVYSSLVYEYSFNLEVLWEATSIISSLEVLREVGTISGVQLVTFIDTPTKGTAVLEYVPGTSYWSA